MKYTPILLSLLLPVLTSCSGSTDGEDSPTAADSLYMLNVQAIKAYTDSLRLANDSASLASAINGLEERLKEINEKFPLNTDSQIVEGRQDTIIRLTEEYLKVKESRLHPKADPDTTDTSK